MNVSYLWGSDALLIPCCLDKGSNFLTTDRDPYLCAHCCCFFWKYVVCLYLVKEICSSPKCWGCRNLQLSIFVIVPTQTVGINLIGSCVHFNIHLDHDCLWSPGLEVWVPLPSLSYLWCVVKMDMFQVSTKPDIETRVCGMKNMPDMTNLHLRLPLPSPICKLIRNSCNPNPSVQQLSY